MCNKTEGPSPLEPAQHPAAHEPCLRDLAAQEGRGAGERTSPAVKLSASGCTWAWMLVDNRLVPTGTCFIAFTTANAISGDSRRPSVSFSTTSLMSSQPERRVRMAGRLNAPKQGPYHGAAPAAERFPGRLRSSGAMLSNCATHPPSVRSPWKAGSRRLHGLEDWRRWSISNVPAGCGGCFEPLLATLRRTRAVAARTGAPQSTKLRRPGFRDERRQTSGHALGRKQLGCRTPPVCPYVLPQGMHKLCH